MRVFYLLILILLVSRGYSQNFEWGHSFFPVSINSANNGEERNLRCNTINHPSYYNKTKGIHGAKKDKDGNFYFAGNYEDSIKIDSITLINNCSVGPCYEMYIAKFDSAKKLLWVSSFGGPGLDNVAALELDNNGNAYITGIVNGPVNGVVPGYIANFGSLSISAVGQDAFIAKINSQGTWEWVKRIGTDLSNDCGIDLALDKAGNCYLTGSFSGNGVIPGNSGGVLLSNPANINIYVIKLEQVNGNIKWVKTFGGPGNKADYPTDIQCDYLGNIYISGVYQDQINFGTLNLSASDTAGFIFKIENNGEPVWGKSFPEEIKFIHPDFSGNLAFAGMYNEEFAIDTFSFTPFRLFKHDIFYGQLDFSGELNWLNRLGSSEKILSFNDINLENYDYITDIKCDDAENILISGGILNPASTDCACHVSPLKSLTNNNAITHKAFIVKSSSRGECLWNITYSDTTTNSNSTNFQFIQPLTAGNFLVYGNNSVRQNYFYLNGDTLNPIGFYFFNQFYVYKTVYKLNDPVYIEIYFNKTAACHGDTIKIPFTASGVYNSNNKFILEISDSSGGFANTIKLDSTIGIAGNDTLLFIVPNSFTPSDHYRFRVNASFPEVRGYASDEFIVSPIPVANAGLDKSICVGDTIILSSANGRFSTWSPNVNIDSLALKTPKVYPDSTQEYILTSTNPGGCFDRDTVKITVVLRPVLNLIPDSSVCKETFIELNPGAAETGVSYLWKPASSVPDPTLNNAFTQIKDTIKYTLIANNGICKDSSAVTINPVPLPSVNIKSDSVICSGLTDTLLMISDANTFFWDSVPGLFTKNTAQTLYKSIQSNWIFGTVTSDFGCKKTDSFFIRSASLPQVLISNDTSICYGDSVEISVQEKGTTYIWTPEDQLSQMIGPAQTISPQTDKRYFINISDGTCSDTGSVFIHVYPEINASAGNDTLVCSNKIIKLNAAGGVSFIWENHPAISNPDISNPEIKINTDQTFIVNVQDVNGCSEKDSVFISVKASPNVDAGKDTSACKGNTIKLKAAGADTYSWTPVNELVNPNTDQPTTAVNIEKWLYVLGASLNGCSSSDSVLIKVLIPGFINAGTDQSICSGEESSLHASGGTNYVWSPNTSISDISSSDPKVNPTSDIEYILTANDINGCSGKDTVKILVHPLPIADAGHDTFVCFGNEITLTAEASDAYFWSTSEETKSIKVKPENNRWYSLYVKDQFCESRKDSINITVLPLPETSFSIDPQRGEFPLTVNFIDKSKESKTTSWNFGNGEFSEEKNPNITFNEPGDYAVKQLITNMYGCSGYSEQKVYVYDRFSLFVPTGFTPNKDGINDDFRFYYSGVQELSMNIFNQWGQLIYTFEKGKSESYWDGKSEQSGQYIYVISYTKMDSEQGIRKGTVALIK